MTNYQSHAPIPHLTDGRPSMQERELRIVKAMLHHADRELTGRSGSVLPHDHAYREFLASRIADYRLEIRYREHVLREMLNLDQFETEHYPNLHDREE